MDPPDHTRLRSLVARAFTVRQVEKLRPQVRELTASLLDDLEAAGPPADLVDTYALPLPVAVICRLLGVPAEDRPRFRVWSDAALSTSSLTAEEFEANREELRAYMGELIAVHRQDPQDDLMTALIEARDGGDRLSELELVDLCVAVLVAGHETTASQIPNFVLTLLDHPDQLARLRARPELIANAVEELLRFVPLGSGAGQPRYATEDVEVGGTLVRAGAPVLVATGAANRDALRFTAPGVLDIARDGNQHLGFGHGVHHCLGAPLARLELQEALSALITRFPGLKLAGDVTWKSADAGPGPARHAGRVVSAMPWTVRVDPQLCLASGMCAGAAPEVFALDGEHARGAAGRRRAGRADPGHRRRLPRPGDHGVRRQPRHRPPPRLTGATGWGEPPQEAAVGPAGTGALGKPPACVSEEQGGPRAGWRAYSKRAVSPAPRRTISSSPPEKSMTVVGSVPQSPGVEHGVHHVVEALLDLPALRHRLVLVGQQQGAGEQRFAELGEQGLSHGVVGDPHADRLLLRVQQLARDLLRRGQDERVTGRASPP